VGVDACEYAAVVFLLLIFVEVSCMFCSGLSSLVMVIFSWEGSN